MSFRSLSLDCLLDCVKTYLMIMLHQAIELATDVEREGGSAFGGRPKSTRAGLRREIVVVGFFFR